MKVVREIAALVLMLTGIALMAVPAIMQTKQGTSCTVTASGRSMAEVSAVARSAGTVDVNQGDLQELMLLPKIGEKTGMAILEERALHGAYHYPEDLLAVRGIGEKTLEGFRNMLKITEGE